VFETQKTNMPKVESKEQTTEPWYKDGLRFKCTACGDCCTGAPGYVWVNQAEINALAERLGMDVAAFEKKYVRQIGIRRSLVEYKNGDCVFFDNQTRKCKVYEQRPRQCRTWPFWNSNLRDPEAWAETCEVCPGSGKGKLYQLEHIQEQAAIFNV
jgi:Fe-S-cluster containining protein